MISYIRVNVASIEGLMNLLAARAETMGATTRSARADLYGMSEASLNDLEPGNRVPTAQEAEQLGDACEVLGASIYPPDLTTLPAS